MRWQQLFADLGAQFAEAEAAAHPGRAGAPARRAAGGGAVRLADRLAGAVGHPVVLRCRGAGPVAGTLVEVGVDWLLVAEDAGREALVATAAVLSVSGLGRQTAAPESPGAVRGRFDLRRAVRALA